jgi:predicted O-linked N-acetylglucosamine transferase (SPINDLY family)
LSKRSVEALRTLLGKAVAAHQSGQSSEAERLYRKILQTDPEQFDTLRLFGHLELKRGRPEPAVKLFTRALRVNVASAEVLANRGAALLSLDRPDQAVEDFAKALTLDPQNAGLYNNLGNALSRLARGEAALAAYDRAVTIRPDFAQAHCNRGNVLFDLGLYERALSDFDAALALRPDYAEAAHNRGICLRALRQLEPALASFNRALALRPAYPEALNSKGVLLRELDRYGEAASVFAELVRIEPRFPYALGARLNARLHECDWSTLQEDLAAIQAGIRERRRVTEPFALLATVDDPAQQLLCTRIFVENDIPAPPAPIWQCERYGHDKIRIGYVSGDFGEHPVAYLMAEVFERHRRDRFEIIGISLKRREGEATRSRLVRAFDDFIDVQGHSELDIARVIRNREIDIAIDLMGCTLGNRMGVFAHRPAPVQVNYLGYSATSGSRFMDYIIADRTVIPDGASEYYSEHVARLPDQFFANSPRIVTQSTPDRTQLGLPEAGFVFCFLSSHYKLLPQTFSIWMRLLHSVAESVLWLGDFSPSVKNNLRREAAKAGIDPERLVFASRTDRLEDHLARYRCADLLVDTFPYNAHTTTSDALLAGLPVLTCMGRTFASRIAGSLLIAAGLPELVTRSLVEYEALALRLATEPTLLASIRARLAQNQSTFPLFDCARFTKSLEAAYVHMWERSDRGEPPAAFSL